MYQLKKRILITGGTGSFGKYITRKLLNYQPEEIRILSRGEDKQYQMQKEFDSPIIRFFIGDVRDYKRLLDVTKDIDIIYHAAALKQVHMIESHPYEAVKTNVIGTWNVRQVAKELGVEKVILISTDKAVKPVNAYGMTKALSEKIFTSEGSSSSTKFAVVRYGNVIGSTGSVIPFFKKLIEEEKPLPITDTKMTRFLITLEQSINLVIYATEQTKGGEIFIPKLPACKIVDLVEVMGGKGYKMQVIGIRPGEKIHECLINEDEMRRAKLQDNIFIIYPYGSYTSNFEGEFISKNTLILNKNKLSILLKKEGWIS